MKEEIPWGRIIIAAMALGAALTAYLMHPSDATLPILSGVITGLMFYFAGLYTKTPANGQRTGAIQISHQTSDPIQTPAVEPPVTPTPPTG